FEMGWVRHSGAAAITFYSFPHHCCPFLPHFPLSSHSLVPTTVVDKLSLPTVVATLHYSDACHSNVCNYAPSHVQVCLAMRVPRARDPSARANWPQGGPGTFAPSPLIGSISDSYGTHIRGRSWHPCTNASTTRRPLHATTNLCRVYSHYAMCQ